MQISLEALRDGNSKRLFFGQLISQACDKMMSIGLVWMFAERYPESTIAWFLGVSALPHLFLAWHAGRWTAALGQQRVLVLTDAARAVVFIALAAAWPAVAADKALLAVFIASFISNFASALFNPAMFSMPVALTTDPARLQQLSAMIDSCFSIGNVIGPAATAALYPWLGLRGLFLFNGLSYGVAAALEAGMRLPTADSQSSAEAPAAPRPTLEVVLSDRLVAIMLAGFLVSNLCLTPLMVFLPLFVKSSYGAAIGTLAMLELLMGAGTVAGGAILSAVKLDARLGLKIAAGMLGVALAYIAFSVTRTPVSGAVCMAVLGFFLSTTNVFSMTLFQTRLAPPDVPVLMSLVNLISVASLPLSMAVTAALVQAFDVRTLATAFSAALLLVTLVIVSNPKLRNAP